jgi:uncharacterized surface protein with fasciclin (FAS1) repeats
MGFQRFRDLLRHAFPGAAAEVAARLNTSLDELFGQFNSLISKEEYFMSVLLNAGLVLGIGAVLASSVTFASEKEAKMDIVDTAVKAGSFKTLAAALKAAGLVDTLKGKGPFTVFAPTDEAFEKLPPGTVETLLKPENKDKLVAILTYHVVPGNVKAADVVKLKSAKTVQGQTVTIDATDGVKINNAKVVKADIDCGNGVIHVIDTVLLPKE